MEKYKIDTTKSNLLPNERLESFWDAVWLGIRTFLCFNVCKIVQSHPVQSRPVPSSPVPSSPVPSSPVPSAVFVNLRLGPAECA